MTPKERFELIKRNTQEIVSEAELKALLRSKKPSAYIGYAPTGKIHIGYLFPLTKAIDFVDAGVNFTFLIADLHAHLDDRKTPWELLKWRSKYYEEAIKALISSLGGKTSRFKFILGSSFQNNDKYFLPILRMAAETTITRTKRAASEVVRFGNTPKLGGFIYPLMQTQDIVALGADIAFGGIDQRGIYMLSRELLPQFGLKKPTCVFTPLLPGLTGGKMSASTEDSKIDILDYPTVIRKKIAGAFCPAGKKEGNGVLSLIEVVIFPWLERQGKSLTINRPSKFGGDITYKDYIALEKDYLANQLHPADLKATLAEALIDLLAPVRKHFAGKQNLLKKAYP